MLQIFLEEDRVGECNTIIRVICSGESLPYDLQNRFFDKLPGAQIYNLYGPTEAAVDVTYWHCKKTTNLRVVPIGFPIANTKIYILDNNLQLVPPGCVGELHIAGIQVARGYLNRPELTAERFVPDPFSNEPNARLYKTGDLARYLPDGNIEYLGRTDFQVKIRGLRIELGEIETRLSEFPGVRQCAVLAREDQPGDKRLVAYLVNGSEDKISNADLRKYLRQSLPDYMIPQHFVLLDSIPLSPNGKADRKALPKPSIDRQIDQNYLAPRNDIENTITNIWQDLLQIDKVGVHDSFFELGGHSLLMARVLRRLTQTVSDNLSIVDLFQYPTVASLAAFLNQKEDTNRVIERAQDLAGKQIAALKNQKRRAMERRRLHGR
jgi:hypothetical protein